MINKYIKEFQPDSIISLSAVSNMLTLIACGFKSIKVTVSERTDPAHHPKSKLASMMRSFLYTYFADTIVFQTKKQKEWFSQKIQEKGIIIPNAVMPGLPEPYKGEREKIISGAGSLTDQKDWITAIKAFEIFAACHDGYKFIIWGEGDERANLEEYISTHAILKNRVLLNGYSDSVHEKICKSSLFISSAAYDGISNSILEALALGLPCVCTDAAGGGGRFLIQNGENGLLVDVGDYRAMAQAMIKMIDDKKFAEYCSYNAIKVRERYGIGRIVDAWEKTIMT